MYVEHFLVDNLRYVFEVDEGHCLSFSLLGGATRRGIFAKKNRDDLFDPDPWEDVDFVTRPWTVLRKATEIGLRWIMRTRPKNFSVAAATARKSAVYSRYFQRVLAKHPKISCEYHIYENNPGNFACYRKQEQAVNC